MLKHLQMPLVKFPMMGLALVFLLVSVFHNTQSTKASPNNSQVSANVSSEGGNHFYWKLVNGIPTTFVRTTRGDVPFIEWANLYFEKAGYPPEVRAKQVTARLNQYFNQCPQLQVTHDTVISPTGAIVPILKAVDNANGCNGLIYTLRKGVDGEQAVKRLSDLLTNAFNSEVATESPQREAKCSTYLNIGAIVDGDVNKISETKCSE